MSARDLIDQHTYLQPKAKHIIKDDPLLTNKDAWKKAYKDNVGGQRPLDAILQGLIRYCAYTGLTTHGAESAHSVADWLHPKRRASLKSKTKNDEMILVMDQRDDIDEELISMAQSIWKEHYSGTRRSHEKNVCNPRGPKLGKTFKNFIMRRRDEARQVGQQAPFRTFEETIQRGRSAGQHHWESAMDDEVEFNRKKRRDWFLKSIWEGVIK